MDREKQKEEMFFDVVKAFNYARDFCANQGGCDICENRKHGRNCDFLSMSEHLYTAGYRKIPDNIGEFSDGYHTFNELYHHRAILFSVICNSMPDKAWKSKLHDTGDMYDGMFIVGIETPEGQATYHYDIEPYWDMFNVKELEKAPKWDGHTPQVAIDRIAKLNFGVIRLWENLLKAEAQEVPIKAERIRVAREIFEDIEKSFIEYYDKTITYSSPTLPLHFREAVGFSLNEMFMKIAELKKKYTESEDTEV